MRNYQHHTSPKLDLDNLLLVIAQSGTFLYSICSILFALMRWTSEKTINSTFACALADAIFELVQTLLQSFFILDSSRKRPNADQAHHKPGREATIFLFVCNLFMWAVTISWPNNLEHHPYAKVGNGGLWSTITHLTLPLAIFYRFHSTVCLWEIWKNCFKERNVARCRSFA